MKKMKIICLVVSVLLLAVGFLIAFSRKPGYSESADLSDESIADLTILDATYVDLVSEMPNAEFLLESSDIVLVVKAAGERSLRNESVLSKAEVTEIVFGDPPSSDTIYIYEPIIMILYPENTGNSIFISGECLMQKDKEYLVFLKKTQWPEGYQETETEANSFLYTNEYCSSFCLDPEYSIAVTPSEVKATDGYNSECRYADIQKVDFMGKKEAVDMYKEMKTILFEKFGFASD